MSLLQDKLNGLRDGLNLRIALESLPQPGQPAVARIENLPTSLTLVDTVTQTVESRVRLTWLTKDVMFATDDLETAMETFPPNLSSLNGLVTGPKPVFNPGTLVAIPGTPGLVGQMLAGIPIPTTVTTEIPVSIGVVWEALDAAGTPLPPDGFKQMEASPDRAAYLFAPDIVEDKGTTAAPKTRTIRATVTLSATVPAVPPATTPGTITARVELSVVVPVPALSIPTVIGLFVHAGFDLTTRGGTHGNVMLVLPPESPYRSLAALAGILDPLAQALNLLLSVGFTSLPGLGPLDLMAQTVVRLVRTLTALADPASPATFLVLASSGEPKLSRFQFPNDQGCNDTFGALLLLGAAGKGAVFFNAEEHRDDEGAFEVKVLPRHIAVVIPSLHDLVGPRAQPKSIPAGSTSPRTQTREGETFGNRISSFALL